MDGRPNAYDGVAEVWSEVLTDLEATAEEYRGEGWEVLAVHPGDVTALDGSGPEGRWGLDVLVPDNEFSELQRYVDGDDATFEACEVFKAETNGVVYLVVAMFDEATERAVVFPAYYVATDPGSQALLERAHDAGQMRTHLRPLSNEPVVTFRQDDPGLFAPDE